MRRLGPSLRALAALGALLGPVPGLHPAPARAGEGGRGWRDLYSEVYGWRRHAGASRTADAVPTLRLRAGVRPWAGLDLGPYLYVQATRDLASRGGGPGGQPQLLADNAALVGAGLLWRLWDGRAGLFVQGGPAFGLLDTGRRRTALDLRAGGQVGLETARCAPRTVAGLVPCAELYGEVVYLSRFDDDVVGVLRGRTAVTWLVTGPVAWQLAAEARVGADRNGDFYDNFVDAGLGPRLRLTRPFRLDLFPSLSAGRYLGRSNRDPAPDPLTFAELRLQVATSFDF